MSGPEPLANSPEATQDDARAPLVLYTQLTLGPPHLARIKALDALDGIRCRGVQLATGERTRRFRYDDADAPYVTTVVDGEYESLPRRRVLQQAIRHIERLGASALIIDSPADPIQFLLGRAMQRRGVLTFTRWAATWADHPRHGWKEWLKGFVYRGWDGYLATGERSVEYARTFGISESAIHICGNPVDASPITETRLASGSRPPRNRSFLFVGRFLRLKNLERFARAWLSYKRAGGCWTLDLVGFGESEEAVRQTFEASPVDPEVVFHGHLQQAELIPLYAQSGCLILPSYSENWGLVVNEAMHAGMPIAISTVTGCAPELLAEGENGFSMDPFSEASMTETLHRVERCSDGELRSMGARSLEIISAHGTDAWASATADALGLAGLRTAGPPRR